MAKKVMRTGPTPKAQERQKPDYDRLNELIDKARGDRSWLQYAKDAEVDHAVLSKIRQGKYQPGKAVLQRLGSPEAKPQGGVTTADLMTAAGFTAESLVLMKSAHTMSRLALAASGGLLSGIPVVGIGAAAALATFALALRKVNRPLSAAEQEQADPELVKYVKAREKYKTTARGILFSALAIKGVTFQPGNINTIDTFGFRPDDYVTILDHKDINSWWFKYGITVGDDDTADIPFEDLISAFMQQVVTVQADKHRKISFVVDNPRAFSLLKQYKNHISFRGNLSVIQIDTENVTIVDEALISTYDEDRSDDPLSIL